MESRQEERAKPGLRPESRTIKLGELFVLQLCHVKFHRYSIVANAKVE